MAYKRDFQPQPLTLLPPCMHLRSKAIYVTGDPDPRTPEEASSTRFNCWCNRTQYVIGPDHVLVERGTCIEGRDCYEGRQ
ncbi:MAG: hypothetical protein R3E01_00630 [Pirellulaceae bacterium]|nr:hypothetical protein [Planctomycetales bacterium]